MLVMQVYGVGACEQAAPASAVGFLKSMRDDCIEKKIAVAPSRHPPDIVRLALRQRAHEAGQLAAEARPHAGQHECTLAPRLRGARNHVLGSLYVIGQQQQRSRQRAADSRQRSRQGRTLMSFLGLGSSLATEEVSESAAAPPVAAAAASAANSSRMMVTLLLPSRWACSATTKSCSRAGAGGRM